MDPLDDAANEVENTMKNAAPEQQRKLRRAFFGGMLGMAGIFALLYLTLEIGR